MSAEPSPSPTSERERAQVHAQELVQEYYHVLDQAQTQPDSSNLELETVAGSVELANLNAELDAWNSDGWHQSGATTIVRSEIQHVSLDNSDPASGDVPTVQIDVCYDVAQVDVLDRDGKSVVDPDRDDRGWERLYIANYNYEEDPEGSWRVADLETLERQPCDAP